MPRGRKSKANARERRRQAQSQSQSLQKALAPAAQVKESTSSLSPPFAGNPNPQSSPAAESDSKAQGSLGALPVTTPEGAASTRSDEGAQNQDGETPGTSQAPPSTNPVRESTLDKKASLLVQFMLHKYNMKEPITKQHMIKHVIRKHKQHFHEILKKASEIMELAFSTDVKEADPDGNSYVLVSKLQDTSEERLSGKIMPNRGILMTILSVIFMKGNCASEKDIWDVLNVMGIYAGGKYNIYEEPKKLITDDLVQEGYLEDRQVPESDPPCYEVLWGPKTRAEISKMEVLNFLARLHDTHPTAFPVLYEEAQRDEEERASARSAAASP